MSFGPAILAAIGGYGRGRAAKADAAQKHSEFEEQEKQSQEQIDEQKTRDASQAAYETAQTQAEKQNALIAARQAGYTVNPDGSLAPLPVPQWTSPQTRQVRPNNGVAAAHPRCLIFRSFIKRARSKRTITVMRITATRTQQPRARRHKTHLRSPRRIKKIPKRTWLIRREPQNLGRRAFLTKRARTQSAIFHSALAKLQGGTTPLRCSARR
jgi:multidrug efflux pump subunit AcrA (membrane-fusion protein)